MTALQRPLPGAPDVFQLLPVSARVALRVGPQDGVERLFVKEPDQLLACVLIRRHAWLRLCGHLLENGAG